MMTTKNNPVATLTKLHQEILRAQRAYRKTEKNLLPHKFAFFKSLDQYHEVLTELINQHLRDNNEGWCCYCLRVQPIDQIILQLHQGKKIRLSEGLVGIRRDETPFRELRPICDKCRAKGNTLANNEEDVYISTPIIKTKEGLFLDSQRISEKNLAFRQIPDHLIDQLVERFGLPKNLRRDSCGRPKLAKHEARTHVLQNHEEIYPEVILEKALSETKTTLAAHMITVVEEVHKPWGAYLVIDEGDIKKFCELFFPNTPFSSFHKGEKLSPKILIILPGEELSWQLHERRDELWWIIGGEGYILTSSDDNKPDPKELLSSQNQDAAFYINANIRHTAICPEKTSKPMVIAEAWKHIGRHPSDEDDIVRVCDPYAHLR